MNKEQQIKEISETYEDVMYQKYTAYQAEKPTAIVAYRLGDFYEVLGDNAVLLGNELNLTIISRGVGLKECIPIVGFPYHAAENYFAKIVKYHDLYIIESDNEKQFIERIEKKNAACLCMKDATNKEKLTGRCMYFEKDN